MGELAVTVSEIHQFRQVLGNLIARDLKVKYQTKTLGFVWSMLHPAIMLIIWYVIFNRVIRLNVYHYWAFLITGIIPFQFVTTGIIDASTAIRRNAGIIRKIYVPMEVLVIAAVTVKLIEFLLQLALALLLLALLHRTAVDVHIPFVAHTNAGISLFKSLIVLPGAIALMYLLVLGIGLPLAGWSVIYRDLDHIIGIAMTALIYLTPVFWSLHMVPGVSWWKHLFLLNPAMAIIELMRSPMYAGSWPINSAIPYAGATGAWTVASAITAVCLVGGVVAFNRTKRLLSEVV